MKLFGKLFNLELILAFNFLIIPIVLPLFSGKFLDSLSLYAYSEYNLLYYVLMAITGALLLIDGIIDKIRRYNIVLGSLFLGVILFPVLEWRLTHDIITILFFIGYVFIVTWHTISLTKLKKLMITCIISISLMLFFADIFSLYAAEAIGMLILSYFMTMRYLVKIKKVKLVVN